MTKKNEEKEIIKKHNKELIELKKKADEYLNNWKRSQADYFNLKRRVDEEKKEILSLANKDLIMQILPILDNFRRAFNQVPNEYKDSDWLSGIKQLEKQLEKIISNEGLERILTVGQEFNPNFHEAVLSEEKKGVQKGTILEELESGYKINNKVVKAAKVKVAK